jgi:hypothetical protein
VHGEFVIWSPRIRTSFLGAQHEYVRGYIRDDRMHLEHDLDRVDYQYPFTLDAVLGPEAQLEGEFSVADVVESAPLSCRPLERRAIQVAASYVLPYTVSAMAFDGSNLLLSSIEREYVRATPQMVDLGSVRVLYENIGYWTSSALSYDGSSFWGFLPVTVQGPNWSRNESKMIGFDASGQIVSMFYLPHRTDGLAYDGADYWSMDSEGPRLHRYDATGAILETLTIDVPDATDLEADATSFWTTGWYLERLYRLDRTGRAIAVYDLPQEGVGYCSALALEGPAVWHAQDDPFAGSARIYRLLPE